MGSSIIVVCETFVVNKSRIIMTSSMIKCRTFDVNDTGRISESKFRQILATKQVPKDDVEGILQGIEMKKSKT